jgi:hypothetical protein
MWSVNIDTLVSGEYQTLGGHSGQPFRVTESAGVMPGITDDKPGSASGKPRSTGDMSRSISIDSKAIWEKPHLPWKFCGAPGNDRYYLSFNDF